TIGAAAGVCIEISTEQTANQLCTFNQHANLTNPHLNLASALQVIVARNGGPSGAQAGTQTINTTQQNTTKPNLSFAVQILKQSVGVGANDPDYEVSEQAGPEKMGELSRVLPDFGPLIATLQSVES